MKKKVLVAGATGYLGQFVVRELKKRGYWVRVLIRKDSQKEQFEKVDEFFVGRITNKESLLGITKSIDWVFSSVGITRQKEGMSYMDVDYQGNANLLEEAVKSNVELFQYVSAINGDGLRQLKIFEAKERFVDELKKSGIPYSVLRPNGFFSDMSDFLDMAKAGRVYLFGHGNFKLNPIDGKDLATVCIDKMEVKEKEATIGGPDILSHIDLATLALKAWNKPTKITRLPDWTRTFIIWFLRSFTSPKTYGPIEFFLTAMANDNIAEQYGNRHLKDFFKEKVKQQNNDTN